MKILLAIAFVFIAAQPQQVITARRRVVSSGCASPFTDNFTRANGPLVSPYSTNGPVGGFTFAISSNTLTTQTFATGYQYAWISGCSGLTTSQYAQFVITTAAGPVFGAVVNQVDANNAYQLYCTLGGGCEVHTLIAGAVTYVSSYSLSVTTGSTVCFEEDSGTSFKLKVNGTYNSYAISASGVTGTGYPGLLLQNQGPTPAAFTAFQAGNGVCP